MNDVPNGFSIVICSYNGVIRLKPTLSHIAALKVPQGKGIELILVNNASTDRTESFVKNVWGEFNQPFPLTVLYESRPGKGYAVETGYDAAKYELIVTVDDDNWLKDDYLLQAYQQYVENPSLVLLGGRGIAEFEEEVPKWVEDVMYHNAVGSQQPFSGRMSSSNYLFWGAGMIVRNAFWKELRLSGFSFITSRQTGKAMGEDTELSIVAVLAGNERFYCENLVFTHFMPKGRFNWERTLNHFAGFGSTHIVFDAYYHIFDCIQQDKQPDKMFWLNQFFRKLKCLGNFTLKQWIFYFIIKPKGEYYILKQKMLLSELKHTFIFFKNQDFIFTSLYNWQTKFLK